MKTKTVVFLLGVLVVGCLGFLSQNLVEDQPIKLYRVHDLRRDVYVTCAVPQYGGSIDCDWEGVNND